MTDQAFSIMGATAQSYKQWHLVFDAQAGIRAFPETDLALSPCS